MLKGAVAVSSESPMPERSSEKTLWKSILEESGSKAHLSSGLVLMVGPKGSGKSALLKTFKLGNGETEGVADSDPKFHAILDYCYFDAIDSMGFVETQADREDAAQTRVSVWSCSNLDHAPVLEKVVPPSKIDKLVVTVVVDLSQPWELITQLEAWINVVDELLSNLQTRPPAPSSAGSMPGNGRYEESAASKQGTGSGVQLVVVACKSDLVKGETFEQQQRLHFIQQILSKERRAAYLLCLFSERFQLHKAGAIDPSPSQRYLLHLLHPNAFSFNDEASLGTEDIFIPSGWDSEALIDSILLEDWAKSSSFNDVILPPVSSNSSNQMHQEEGELESEQQWLLGLSKLVSSAPGTEASSHTTITSPSRMPKNLSDSKAMQSRTEETTDSKQLRSFFEGLLQKS